MSTPTSGGMTRSRWVVLILVVLALGLSVAYGLKPSKSAGTAPTSEAIKKLQAAADLEPCPAAISPALPKATLPCLGGGRPVTIDAAATGRPTLVNIYGSWCHPCFQEMPVLRDFYAAAHTKVALVGVDSEDDFSLALRFAKDVGQTWPSVYDNNKVVVSHLNVGTPTTLFINASGAVVYRHSGAFTSVAQMDDLVKTYLGVST